MTSFFFLSPGRLEQGKRYDDLQSQTFLSQEWAVVSDRPAGKPWRGHLFLLLGVGGESDLLHILSASLVLLHFWITADVMCVVLLFSEIPS